MGEVEVEVEAAEVAVVEEIALIKLITIELDLTKIALLTMQSDTKSIQILLLTPGSENSMP